MSRPPDPPGRPRRLLAKSGFTERRIRLEEGQAKILVEVIRAILARLSLTGEQQALARVVVPEELRRADTVAGEVVR